MRKPKIIFLLILLALAALLLVACGKPQAGETTDENKHTVIEAGVDPIDDTTDPGAEVDPFVDKGANSSVADVVAAQAKIESFYFEQRLEYADGAVFIQVWFAENRMKLISSVDGYGLVEYYYNYNNSTMIRYYPGTNEPPSEESIDFSGLDAPDNPVKEDYSTYTLIGGEEINRQYCLVFETPRGDKLWVGTKYGFPLQTAYVDDTSGETRTSQYKNIKINSTTLADVLPPDDFGL